MKLELLDELLEVTEVHHQLRGGGIPLGNGKFFWTGRLFPMQIPTHCGPLCLKEEGGPVETFWRSEEEDEDADDRSRTKVVCGKSFWLTKDYTSMPGSNQGDT